MNIKAGIGEQRDKEQTGGKMKKRQTSQQMLLVLGRIEKVVRGEVNGWRQQQTQQTQGELLHLRQQSALNPRYQRSVPDC